jgi:hypothetical protein
MRRDILIPFALTGVIAAVVLLTEESSAGQKKESQPTSVGCSNAGWPDVPFERVRPSPREYGNDRLGLPMEAK